MHLRLGTRKSLLAWAQSGWVARRIEETSPGVRVELVGIETQGDRILDISLRKVEGKEFFVAELDQALAAGKVDLTVHSMKDLSLDRPAAFVCAANPRRENPRDVILFGPGVLDKIAGGRTLRIGTSSPRRIENIPSFLQSALPTVGGREPHAELVEIRGNVNTRLGRVHEPEGSERHLDGVVLAFAGLIRLWADPTGREELSKLLSGVRWMVLPLRECPTAPAQGALAIECRSEDARLREILARIHDPETARQVGRERELLARWGGGCHQRFGATCVPSSAAGELLYIRGALPGGEFVDRIDWNAPAAPAERGPAWNGVEWRISSGQHATIAYDEAALHSAPAYFVSHSRAVDSCAASSLANSGARVWTSGVSSWFRLARQGIWVEGCAEGLGFESLRPQLAEGVLQLPRLGGDWCVLTHRDAAGEWGPGAEMPHLVLTYEVGGSGAAYSADARAALARAVHVFWSSASQFDALKQEAKSARTHACGPGRTADRIAGTLRAAGVDVRVFPSAEEWKRWLEN